ncbi:MAG: hypothetical protein IT178_07310 [Acidobacteria bacterium]|nr:hypothetical protein [Acidobacteriota bacterium]
MASVEQIPIPPFVPVLAQRVRAEYDEMPGLSLTFAQAIRLWNLDAPICAQVLEELVRRGYLRLSDGRYLRA